MTYSQKIFELTAPYNNQYQGNFTRLLFVCTVGMLRSPTAAEVATENGFNCRSCGWDEVALIRLSANLIMWADHIVFMNPEAKIESLKLFENTGYEEDIKAKAMLMHVDDDYNFGDPILRIIVHNWIKQKRVENQLSVVRT